MKVTIVTPSLDVGGAERFLLRLSRQLHSQGDGVRVECLASDGALRSEFTAAGIPVRFVGVGRELSIPRAVSLLADGISDERPDAVQGFMYLGDVFATAASLLAKHRAVFWSIRTSRLPAQTRLARRLLPYALAPSSHIIPRRIVSCSPEASRLHVLRGYARHKISHIPNSVEGWAIRERSESRILYGHQGPIRLGMAARYDPGKGHVELVRAATLLRSRGFDVALTFVGRGTEPGGSLERDISRLNLDRIPVEFGGIRDSRGMADWMRHDLDLYIMGSSRWEAFPNSLAEAVAMGVPALAANVGSAWRLVPRMSRLDSPLAPSIASGVERFLRLEQRDLRERVQTHASQLKHLLDAGTVARRYLHTWST